MDAPADKTQTVIVLSTDQASFYEFLKARQEMDGRVVVILERRRVERRQRRKTTAKDRRQSNRRSDTPQAALALMSVLGFMVLHRAGESWVP